jgi:hypothetical protein
MKQIALAGILLGVCVLGLYAQDTENALQYTVDDTVQLLENDFEKYPYAELFYNKKSQDVRAPFTKVQRQVYQDGDIAGELVTFDIVKGGWRYEVKIDFTTNKHVHSKRSYDVKKAVYQSINEMLPKKTEQQ